MKNIIVLVAAILVCSGCATNSGRTEYDDLRDIHMAEVAGYSESVKADLANDTQQHVIEKGKMAISKILKDPESVKFRNVRLVKYLNGYVICGELNSKNSYGGYVGFSDFVAGTKSGSLRENGRYGEPITSIANSGINAACSGEVYQVQ